MARWDEEPDRGNLRVDVWHHTRVVLTFGGILAVLWALAQDPLWVENSYVNGWGHTLASTSASVSSFVPFSLAEILILLWVVWLLIAAVKVLGTLRRRTWGNVLVHMGLSASTIALVLGAWFYLVWGVSYARPSAVDRLGLNVVSAGTPPDADERLALERLLRLSIVRANAAYAEIHGSQDGGVVTVPGRTTDVDQAIEVGYARVGSVLQQPAWFAERRPPVKLPFGSVLLSHLHVAGIYIPFTGEATVNAGPPAWSRVFTAAHEKAHQRMIASEGDANFFGFLACIHADDPLVRYAGWQFARGQLFRALYLVDQPKAEQLNATLGPGAQRDVGEVRLYWDSYEGTLGDLQRAVNDLYLKANHVEGGVQAYDRSVRLLEAWLVTGHGLAMLAGDKPVSAH